MENKAVVDLSLPAPSPPPTQALRLAPKLPEMVAAEPADRSVDLGDLEREIEGLKTRMVQDAEIEWQGARKTQGEMETKRISELAESAFRSIEEAMHSDVEGALRCTPEALAESSSSRVRAQQALSALSGACDAARRHGENSLAEIRQIVMEFPTHNLASKPLRYLAEVRSKAIEYEEKSAVSSVAQRLLRLQAERKLGQVAFDSGAVIKKDEEKELRELSGRFEEKQKQDIEVFSQEARDAALFWEKSCKDLVRALAAAGSVSEASALEQSCRILLQRASDPNPSADELLRMLEGSLATAKSAISASISGRAEQGGQEEPEAITKKRKELRGMEDALAKLRIQETAEVALASHSAGTRFVQSLEERQKAEREFGNSALAIQQRIASLRAEVLTLQAEHSRNIAEGVLAGRQEIGSEKWTTLVAEVSARVKDIRKDVSHRRDVGSRAKLDVQAEVRARYMSIRVAECEAYRRGCEQLGQEEEAVARAADRAGDIERRRFQDIEQRLGDEMVRILQSVDPSSRMAAEGADARMQSATSYAQQFALSKAICRRLDEMSSILGYPAPAQGANDTPEDETFTPHNDLWRVMRATSQMSPFHGFWRFTGNAQQEQMLRERFPDLDMEKVRQQFRTVAAQIQDKYPNAEGMEIEFCIYRGADVSRSAAHGMSCPVILKELRDTWVYPSWFSDV